MVSIHDRLSALSLFSVPGKPKFSAMSALPQPTSQPQVSGMTSAQASALRGAALFGARSPRFGSAVLSDRHVEMRVDTPLNARVVAKILHGLLFQHIAKGRADKGSVKLQLNAHGADGYSYMDQAALGDVMTFLDRPTDIVITHYAGPSALRALASATGKRFMTVGAELDLGPIESIFGTRKGNDDTQNYARLYAGYLRDLEWLVMHRAGVDSREQVNRDLQSGKGLTSLAALAYGKNGLIDYILVGHDRVITRPDLDQYYAEHGIDTDKKKDLFNRNLDNIDLLPTRPLSEVYPAALPKEELAPFTSLKASKAKAKAKEAKAKEKQKATQPAEAESGNPTYQPPEPEEPKEPKKFTINLQGPSGIQSIDDVPGKIKIEDKKGKPVPDAYLLENVPAGLRSVLIGDFINLSSGFGVDTSEKIVNAIRYLTQEKAKSGDKTPIRLLVNSPGGAVIAGQEIRDAMAMAAARGVKTDVIAYGMASSCGSWTLSSATGVRLATPGARVMIHQANGVPGNLPGPYYLANAAGLNQATETYQRIVAKATGRPYEDVAADFRTDTWLNPVESLFYGPKGLIDAILVGPNKVITRDAVEKYLTEVFGSKEAVLQKAEEAINAHRKIETDFEAADHNENDPFRNPLKTIQEVIKRGGATTFDKASLAKLHEAKPTGAARETMEIFHSTHAPGEDG